METRWCRENKMAAESIRQMAEGKMVERKGLVDLEDGALVQVLGNVCG